MAPHRIRAPRRSGTDNTTLLTLGGFFLILTCALAASASAAGTHYMGIPTAVAWVIGGTLLTLARRRDNFWVLVWAIVMCTMAAAMYAATVLDIAWAVLGSLVLYLGLVLIYASRVE